MMNRSAIGLSLVSVLVTLAACSSTNPYIAPQERDWEELAPPPSSEQIYRVILIGDAGDASPEAPVLKLLRTTVDYTDEHSAVIFLGDNLYCCGLPDSGAVDRAQAEARLTAQLDAVKDFPGRIFFIPGNHDWNGGQPGGREALARQEAFVEAYLDRGNTFVPDDGYPGPIAIELTDRITLLALDTEWWLSDERPFGDTGAYRLREPTDLLFELRDLFVKHRNKDLLIIGHHPLFSNGKHSGHFSLTTHLTPFPILGSLEP